MSHYARVENNIVTQVIVADEDFIATMPGTWIQTSYNSYANKHKLGGTALRGNFAGVGYTYDPENDVFYAPKPFPSWQLNTKSWVWEAPIPAPSNSEFNYWDETTQSWKRY